MIMYRQCSDEGNLDPYRPVMVLRSNRRIKFRHQRRNLCSIDKSPMIRGIKIWNLIPPEKQRATTKVKFETCLRRFHNITQ